MKSPQVLELSGIGRRDVLEKAGIQVRLELPGVGENMQEHTYGTLAWGELIFLLHYAAWSIDVDF